MSWKLLTLRANFGANLAKHILGICLISLLNKIVDTIDSCLNCSVRVYVYLMLFPNKLQEFHAWISSILCTYHSASRRSTLYFECKLRSIRSVVSFLLHSSLKYITIILRYVGSDVSNVMQIVYIQFINGFQWVVKLHVNILYMDE